MQPHPDPKPLPMGEDEQREKAARAFFYRRGVKTLVKLLKKEWARDGSFTTSESNSKPVVEKL